MHRNHYTSGRKLLAGVRPPLPFAAERQFVEACGLRRTELLNLRVRDIRRDEAGRLWIRVAKSRRRGEREVPVIAGNEQVILRIVEDARLFPDLPRSVDVQKARQQYARRLYYHLRRKAPQPHGPGKIDGEAVRAVMQTLGHPDQAVVTRYYLGLREDLESQIATEHIEPGLVDQEQ
jgi:integrase